MEAAELARWTRFAAKGGIGKCTAMQDRVAERPEDLMFLKDDEVTVLMQLPEHDGLYLGYCEGVVGRFQGAHVQFHSKLKKPVMTKRASTANSIFSKGSSSSPSPSIIPLQDPEPSSLRVLVSPPPPLSVPASQSPTSPALQAPSPNPSTDDDIVVWPSQTHPSDSKIPGSVPDTLPQMHSSYRDSKRAEPSISGQNFSQRNSFVSPEPIDVTSANRGSVTTSREQSAYDCGEPSTRISAALSDGEVGIGLSLLQDIASGGDDDWSSIESGRSQSRTPDLKSPYRDSFESVGSTAEGNPSADVTERLQPGDTTTMMSHAAQSRPSSRSVSSTVSTQLSQSDVDDWEGASDIYENYRYSRYSMTSKMSSYSQGSASEVPPPVPRPSIDGASSIDSYSQYSRSSSVASSLIIPSRTQSRASPVMPQSTTRKDRPASLKLQSSSVPLTAFATSVNSPEIHSTISSRHSMTSSPTATSPTFGFGDSASTIRNELESEHGTQIIGPRSSVNLRDGDIVIEDEEELPDMSSISYSRPDDSFSSESTFSDKGTISTYPEPPKDLSPQSDVPTTLLITNHGPPLSPDKSTQSGNPPLSPLSSFPLPPQQPPLRPGLSEFLVAQRAVTGTSRTSLFLPHPNAPKPTPSSSGPMYARETLSLQASLGVSGNSTISVLHQAAAARFAPNGQIRRLTIYGRFDQDLMSSDGPVRVVFTLDPPPPPPSSLNIRKRSPSPGMTPAVSSPLARSEVSSSPSPQPQLLSVPSSGIAQDLIGSPIPRAGFQPQAKGLRPRSRSFSGFNSQTEAAPIIRRNHDDGAEPMQMTYVLSNSGRTTPSSVSTSGRAQSASPGPASVTSDKAMISPPLNTYSPHAPSPLSMSHNDSQPSLQDSVGSLSPMMSPTSYGSSPIPSPPIRQGPNKLRKASSSTALINEPTVPPLDPTPPLRIPRRNASFAAQESYVPSSTSASMPLPRRSASLAPGSLSPSPTFSSVPPSATISRSNWNTTQESPSQMRGLDRRQGSVDTTSSISQQTDPRVASPPPNGSSGLARNTSLRKKLSLPSIRSRSTQISRQEDLVTSPVDNDQDNEMVQAENIEFELIRPVIPQVSSMHSSEDSGFPQRENILLHPDGKPNIPGLLRADSPAISTLSGVSTAPRSPTGDSLPASKSFKSDIESSMDAHRQRELKWMALISSVPASQAKKNKKVKKLIMEGVPSSVRYLVWAHLTDSKARSMPGLYAQLGKRDKVPAFNDIERDARKCYPDQLQLHTVQGTLVSLLQAYLTMVPDIQYETGLSYIAGRLLILAPDEDAFWIFVSLMDTHLRPWFSKNTIQMEVDASLFSKALESNDTQVAKKLYVDLGLSQSAVCRPWFASLFAQSLPVDYLHRVWDIFLYEGVAFLFRVGLALVHCSRRYLLQSNNESSALNHLVHPQTSCLPPSPDAFINLAYSFKLKHDDIRKQRIKMEAQVKRQTQTRVLSTAGLAGAKPGAPISLPR